MTLFLISTLWTPTVCDIHFCIWKLSKFIFMGSLLRSILVCKIPEFWKWKQWDQNFVRFDSGNIHIRESKKPGFTFDNQICLISLSILFYLCLLLFLCWFRVLFLNSIFLNFPLFIIIRYLQAMDSLLKIIRCFFVYRREIPLYSLSDTGANWYSNDQLLWDLTGKGAWLSGVWVKDISNWILLL